MPYLHTHDRTELFFTQGGEGRPIVFVASAWLNSRMWERQLPFFVDQGFRCITYDRRGHGRSDCPWNGYDYDTLADDLESVLAHLDVREAILVSHSAGAGELVRFLSRYGTERVDGIAIVSGTTPFPMRTTDNPDGIERTLMEADLAIRGNDRARWFADNADGFFGVGLPGVCISEEYAQFMIRECLTCSPHATREFFLTGFATDLREELRRIKVPTLVVHGDRDRQAPLDICGRKTAQLVPASSFVLYENAAHGLFVTHAHRLNGDLLAFIRAVSSQPHSAVPPEDVEFVKET